MATEKGSSAKRSRGEIPPWEWAVALIGLVLVAGALGYILYQAAEGDDSPPDLIVEADSIHITPGAYVVPFRILNRGGATAADVLVVGEIRDDAGAIESSETTIAYVPPRSTARGALHFQEDPRRYRLIVRARGYEFP